MNNFKNYGHLAAAVTLIAFSIKLMYFSAVNPNDVVVFTNEKISALDCSVGSKYSNPSIKLAGINKKVIVDKTFVYTTGCHTEEKLKALIGELVDLHVIEGSESYNATSVSLDGIPIYDEDVYEGRTSSTGALVFFFACMYALVTIIKVQGLTKIG